MVAQTIYLKKNLFERLGAFFIRYGLVLVLGWIGAMKFTAYEAEGIKGLVETSPLMSWMYRVLSVQATSNVIGVTELLAALLIAIRPLSAKLSAIQQAIAARLAAAKGTSTTPPPVVAVAPPVVTTPPVLSAPTPTSSSPPSSGVLAPPTLGSGVDPSLLVPPGDTLVTRQPLISAFR